MAINYGTENDKPEVRYFWTKECDTSIIQICTNVEIARITKGDIF